jgi:thioredoxin 1
MFTDWQYYSVVWITLVLLVLVGFVLFRNKPRLPEILAFAGIFVSLAGLYFYLRPIQTQLVGEAAEVQAMIGQGTPVLLEFQSPYCVACLAIKPTIDRVEKEYEGRLLVIRINVQEQAGMQLAPIYRFQYTPTFIFIDGNGTEHWRLIGSFDEIRLSQELAAQ